MKTRRIAWSIVTLLTVCAPTWALDPIAILTPSDVPAGYTNGFASSVAISGNYFAIGASLDPWYSGDAWGAVYVVHRQGLTWTEQVKLSAADGGWLDQFGYSVAMDGDVVVAGAPHYVVDHLSPSGPGAVYVFRRDDHGTPDDPTDDTWAQEAKLTAPDPQFEQLFGWSVGVSGDVIVVGKPGWDEETAEVFRRENSGWVHQATLAVSDTDGFGWFGGSVGVDGRRIVVGAYHVTAGGQRGAAYVFRKDGRAWIEEARLVASNPAPASFGYSVSISGGYIAVGAPGDAEAGSGAGATYLFRRGPLGNWSEQTKLLPYGSTYADVLGYAVALDGNTVAAGAPYADFHRGAVFLFGREGSVWEKTAKLTKTGAPSSNSSGQAVALDGDYCVTGAFKAYVYRVCPGCGTLREFAEFQNCFSRAHTGS